MASVVEKNLNCTRPQFSRMPHAPITPIPADEKSHPGAATRTARPSTMSVFEVSAMMRWCSPYLPTIMAASARCDWMARSLCAASCCTSCPGDRNAFATMGRWPRRARGSSCQPHAWLCRCLHPTRRPLSRPRLSWRGWPRRMRACARVARLAGCGLSLRWRGLGDCLDRR